ncbi:hypothetical protein FHETE_2143 [Fusarium heterosporum]|uniref:Zn(2)-C6 fungal-type domain-containing protein n=1 Tax=Fusarium heterosporum TaxID=42747 RepID=A0A8H5TQB0_FUSHE|nr:hypothetical protein FHETE_2143 [Fusarium heterosporum]
MSGNDHSQFPSQGQNHGTNQQDSFGPVLLDPALIDPALGGPELDEDNGGISMDLNQLPWYQLDPVPAPAPAPAPAGPAFPPSAFPSLTFGTSTSSYYPDTGLDPHAALPDFDSAFDTSAFGSATPSTVATPITDESSFTGTSRGTKRTRASSPDTSGTPAKRTRRNAPRATGAGTDSSPIPTPRRSTRNRTRKPPSKNDADTSDDDKPKRKHPRRSIPIRRRQAILVGGPDETAVAQLHTHSQRKNAKEAGEAAVDIASATVYGRGGTEIVVAGTICDFCANHAVGKQMYAANPVCDWKQIPSIGSEVYNLECSNCANYRSRNRQPGEIANKDDHMCRLPGPVSALIDFKHKKYGDADSRNYAPTACNLCSKKGFFHTCDIDLTLGYYCSRCRRDQNCAVGDAATQPLRRPVKLLQPAWYRHACDRCLMRHKRREAMPAAKCCSWLTDRNEWEQGKSCSQCETDGAICMASEVVIAAPSHQPVPSTWRIRPKFELEEAEKKKDQKPRYHEYLEVTPHATWRSRCQGCESGGRTVPCQVMWTQPYHACERCTQFGIECLVQHLNKAWTRYPIYDLSRVGFGHYTPYVVCKTCKETGRNCDRQRPCDSCKKKNIKCEILVKEVSHGLVARHKTTLNDRRGKAYKPGPLYYLALGYGPDGVNSIKDGRSIEHWIGPIAPIYGITDPDNSRQHYQAINELHREHRPPLGIMPPNGTQLGALANRIPKDLTTFELGNMIAQLWQDPQVPVSDAATYRKIWNQMRDAQLLKMREAGMVGPATDNSAPRSFLGNPVLLDQENLHLGLTLGTPDGIAQVCTQSQSLHDPSQARLQPAQLPGQLPDGQAAHGGDDQQPDMTYQSSYPPIGVDEDLYSADDIVLPWPGQQPNNNVTQQQGNVEYQASNLMSAADFIQQSQPAQSSGSDITQMGPDELRSLFGLDEVSQNRSLMQQRQRWPAAKSPAIVEPTGEGTVFQNRVPRDPNAKMTFNPFLGFTLNQHQKPRPNTNTKSSRWKVFNPLEDLDMDEWRRPRSQPTQEGSGPRLFSVVNGQANQPAPWHDVLSDVPYNYRGERTEHCCAEPSEGGFGYCGSWNNNERDQATCQSLAHRNTVPGYFPICNDCTQGNVKDLFHHEHNPVTETELLSMRAYLCNQCASHISSSAQNAAQYRVIGARRIYGIVADKERSQTTYNPDNNLSNIVEFRSGTEALTGCSCANRMLGTSLCRFHRLYYAEEVLRYSAVIQEWRLSSFKKAVCPSCLAQKPLEQANLSADFGSGFLSGAPTAWACVNCNDWVANEKNGEGNQPRVIDKALWNLNIGRELLGPNQGMAPSRIHMVEDVEMMDA